MLNVPLDHDLNQRFFEVMAAGVPQVVFGDPGLVGEHRHLAERPWYCGCLPNPSACGRSRWRCRRRACESTVVVVKPPTATTAAALLGILTMTL